MTYDLLRTASVPFDSFHFYSPVPVQILLGLSKTFFLLLREKESVVGVRKRAAEVVLL